MDQLGQKSENEKNPLRKHQPDNDTYSANKVYDQDP